MRPINGRTKPVTTVIIEDELLILKGSKYSVGSRPRQAKPHADGGGCELVRFRTQESQDSDGALINLEPIARIPAWKVC